MRQNLNIITLGVSDLKRSVDFYEQGLKWHRSPKSQGDIVFYNLGGIVLALYPVDKLAEDIGISDAGNDFKGFTLAYNTQSEKEVDETLKLAEKAGAKILKPAQSVFWGGYSGYFADPDGFIFEVAFNPFVEFDADFNLIM
ncbi:MAG: VOC family protein [Bacteroidia bacterium]